MMSKRSVRFLYEGGKAVGDKSPKSTSKKDKQKKSQKKDAKSPTPPAKK